MALTLRSNWSKLSSQSKMSVIDPPFFFKNNNNNFKQVEKKPTLAGTMSLRSFVSRRYTNRVEMQPYFILNMAAEKT